MPPTLKVRYINLSVRYLIDETRENDSRKTKTPSNRSHNEIVIFIHASHSLRALSSQKTLPLRQLSRTGSLTPQNTFKTA